MSPKNSDASKVQRTPKDAARVAAFRVVNAVLREGANLDEALADTRSRLKDTRDRAFQRQLVMTVLRHRGEIDAVLEQFLKRKPKGKASAVIAVLQLGLAQALFLDVPAYAAASSSVDLVRRVGFSGHANLVNAIMRRAAQEGPALLEKMDGPVLNTPEWLWKSWCYSYGEGVTRTIAEAHGTEPTLDLSVKEDAEGWATRLNGQVLPTGSIRLSPSGPIGELEGYGDGAWWVQDAAAAIPARLFGDVTDMHIADLCAAPGGKTAQLAAAGAHVVAVDRSADRLKRLNKNFKRLKLKIDVVCADASNWQPVELFDAILLDAPCSATGTLRRHPDITLNKSTSDIASLVTVQDRLLDAATRLVKPGGIIVFCTCSLQPEEGPIRITNALKRLPLEQLPIETHEAPELGSALTPEGALRTLPCHWPELGGIDGFYIARLRRTS